jgi:hypothetical protein
VRRWFGWALGVVLVAAAAQPAAAMAQIAPPEGVQPPVRARALLTPRIVLFGDVVRARVDVVVDTAQADPESVRLATSFSPWEIIRAPERTRREAGSTTYLTTTYTLRCVTGPCVPGGQAAPLEFDPAQLSWAAADDPDVRDSAPVEWPLLTVYSRFNTSNFDADQTSSAPWRAEVVAMPDVSYRLTPGVVTAGAAALAGLLAVVGLVLLFFARPRRTYEPPPEPEPEPLAVLSPLEQALILLEDSARADGAAERRRALELVAEALEERGTLPELVRSARILAWSEDDPEVDETSGVAAQVRTVVEEEQQAAAEAEEELARVD